jgi:uncharacterized protein YyaL (SSP411 family)
MRGADGRLHRTYAAGEVKIDGFLEDYAAVALGLLETAVATADPRYAAEALSLARTGVELFADQDVPGFFSTPADGETPVGRRKPLDDNPTPSGNSLMATLLLRLSRLTGDSGLEALAAGVLRLGADFVERAPHGYGELLCALDTYLSVPQEIVVAGSLGDPGTRELRAAALAPWRPAAVYLFGTGEDAEEDVLPVLAGKTPVDGRPAAYVCERFACRRPVTDPAELLAVLGE